MNLLDTETVIELLRDKRYEEGSISTMTLIEVLRGIAEEKREKTKRLLEESFNVQNLDNDAIMAYCRLYDKLRKEGTSIPDADLLIAATAISRRIPLKTRDDHFKRLEKHELKLTQT